MKTYISILLVIVAFSYTQAQDIQYVSAENGLIVREKPSRGANRVAMLDYGTSIEVTEHTQLQLDVIDNGKKVSGEWVKINGKDAYEFFHEGYVFNGYLTEEKIKRPFKAGFEAFTVSIEGVSLKNPIQNLVNSDALSTYRLEYDESIQGKTVSIKHHQEFRTIEVFQKHENSIAIADNNSHCDVIDWQQYYSSWKPLKKVIANRKFKTKSYSKKDAAKFIDINIEDFKKVVNENCGTTWGASLNAVSALNEYPTKTVISKIFLKVVMTDIDGYKVEKILIFERPMDCDTLIAEL
jgi:hypothetical protein